MKDAVDLLNDQWTAQLTAEPGSLFDDELRPMYRATDPDTSRDAAALALQSASAHRQLAARALLAAGPDGLTDFQLADVTGLAQTSVGKRRHDLQRAGLVFPLLDADGKQVRRPTPSGATAGVYVHATHHQEAAA